MCCCKKIHEIDGRKYVEVDRKAKTGDKIIIKDAYLSEGVYENGDVLTVKERYPDPVYYGVYVEEHKVVVHDFEYKTLEPIETHTQSELDLIANLARRVAALERQINDINEKIDSNTKDIRRLDLDHENTAFKVVDVEQTVWHLEGLAKEISNIMKGQPLDERY